VKNPWGEWEHRFRNLWPHNPTQTDFVRFERKWGVLPESKFDKSIKQFDKDMKAVFDTHYSKEWEE